MKQEINSRHSNSAQGIVNTVLNIKLSGCGVVWLQFYVKGTGHAW